MIGHSYAYSFSFPILTTFLALSAVPHRAAFIPNTLDVDINSEFRTSRYGNPKSCLTLSPSGARRPCPIRIVCAPRTALSRPQSASRSPAGSHRPLPRVALGSARAPAPLTNPAPRVSGPGPARSRASPGRRPATDQVPRRPHKKGLRELIAPQTKRYARLTQQVQNLSQLHRVCVQ